MSVSLSIKELVEHLGGELHTKAMLQKSEELQIKGIATLSCAQKDQLSLYTNKRYLPDLKNTNAAVVLLREEDLALCPVNALVLPDPYLSYAKVSTLFLNRRSYTHSQNARIAEDAIIGKDVNLAEGVVIGSGAKVGNNVEIGSNVVIEEGAEIGDNVLIHSNVTICYNVKIGNDVTIQAGAVIGSDGFGYAPQFNPEVNQLRWHKIAQLGSVTIGDRSQIGANTTIDRGALNDTCIGNDVIIDNLVQIAHNCVIGDGTAIAGCVGLAGSSIVGERCNIGGGVGIAGHLEIASDTTILGMSLINKSITLPGVYASGTVMQTAKDWRKSAVRFTQLDELNKRLSALEKQLKIEKINE